MAEAGGEAVWELPGKCEAEMLGGQVTGSEASLQGIRAGVRADGRDRVRPAPGTEAVPAALDAPPRPRPLGLESPRDGL